MEMGTRTMVRVTLEDIAVSGDDNQFLALLRGEGGQLLPIHIDVVQAISIAAGRTGEHGDRPMTHDLVVTLLSILDAPPKRVEIKELKDGVYYADLVIERGGVDFELDIRPSDAIAVAVRTSTPIFVAAHVLDDNALQDDLTEGSAEA